VTEVGFYHLTSGKLEQVLPRLLEKALAGGHRVVLRGVGEERLDAIDRWLWTYDKEGFLPHGTKADGFADRQPIWLTTGSDVPNGASVLMLIEGAPHGEIDRFARVLDLFDGNDPAALEAARGRWRDCRARGVELTYWQQGERGGWRAAHRVPAAGAALVSGEAAPPSSGATEAPL
jgi:DNA polymerase III subunit chi